MTNKRGKAGRSSTKSVRIATHIPALKLCIEALNATEDNKIHIIEHGMGKSSTPFMHSVKNVEKISSFESKSEWLQCDACGNKRRALHAIELLVENTLIEQVTSAVTVPERTVCLVDGLGNERVKVLTALMSTGAKFIVEHDAEGYSAGDIATRRALCTQHDYTYVQYVGLDPESGIFTKGQAQVLAESADIVKIW